LLATSVVIACAFAALAGAAGAAEPGSPVNELKPEVVGAGIVGERLVCGAGSWTGVVTEFTYEWLRDGLPIAAGVAYNVTAADKGHSLWCVVTAVGPEGTSEAESANSVAISGSTRGSPPVSVQPPEVSGKGAVGETLSCSTGTWTGTPAPGFTYQWVRDVGAGETVIESATAGTYKVTSEDAGHSLACEVTATSSAGSASRLSANAIAIPGEGPENVVAPQVLGVEPAALGEALTCAPGTWNGEPPPTFSYQWVRDRGLPGEAIVGSAAKTYMVEARDEGHSISCNVIATNGSSRGEAMSANSVRVAGSKPQNSALPSVTGTPAVGASLTCEAGTWSGVPAPTYAYQWVRNPGLPGEQAIGEARSSTYVVRVEDRGHSLACEVTAANSEGSASQLSERVVVPAGGNGTPPANISAPRVSGRTRLGSQLTCSEGAWSGTPAPALTYQWLRDGKSIAAATASAYVITEADLGHTLSCVVAAINTQGVASQASANVIELPGVSPASLEPPQVSGTPVVGESLTCLHGTWSGAPAPVLEYQWLRGGVSIEGATASNYTLVVADRGSALSCRVTARNSVGTAEANSANALEIPGDEPLNTALPEITGTPAVGETLSCAPGEWSGDPTPTYSYQWLLEGAEIPGATSETYTVALADRGLSLACEVTASNREGTRSTTSPRVRVPGTKPTDVEAPHISGGAAVGQQLTCNRGVWSGEPPPNFSYRWLRDGAIILAATTATYTVELADQGHLLSCQVIATNSEGATEVESSNSVAISAGRASVEAAPRPAFPPVAASAAVPSTAEILAALRRQLTRVQHLASIASLRRAGLLSLSFAAPCAGRLELSWYEPAHHLPHSRLSTKPLILALSTTSFSRESATTVKLRLTSAGRRVFAQSQRVQFDFEAQFVRPHQRPVTWLQALALESPSRPASTGGASTGGASTGGAAPSSSRHTLRDGLRAPDLGPPT
jgi:hypothetical protein